MIQVTITEYDPLVGTITTSAEEAEHGSLILARAAIDKEILVREVEAEHIQ